MKGQMMSRLQRFMSLWHSLSGRKQTKKGRKAKTHLNACSLSRGATCSTLKHPKMSASPPVPMGVPVTHLHASMHIRADSRFCVLSAGITCTWNKHRRCHLKQFFLQHKTGNHFPKRTSDCETPSLMTCQLQQCGLLRTPVLHRGPGGAMRSVCVCVCEGSYVKF